MLTWQPEAILASQLIPNQLAMQDVVNAPRVFPPLYHKTNGKSQVITYILLLISSQDAKVDRLAFFHVIERLKVIHQLLWSNALWWRVKTFADAKKNRLDVSRSVLCCFNSLVFLADICIEVSHPERFLYMYKVIEQGTWFTPVFLIICIAWPSCPCVAQTWNWTLRNASCCALSTT